MWWQNTVKPHCTDPPLNFGSSACCSHVCPLGFLSCSGWSRGHPGLLKGFLSVCELLYRKKWHFVKQQILSTVLIFSLLSHLDIEIRSITFIEDASYEKSAGEDIFHACLPFQIKLLNQSCSYQVGMSFNNWWRLTLDWTWICFHPGCSPQICQIQLLISFYNHLQGSSKNLCSAYRFYLGTLKVYFVTTNEKSRVTHSANMTMKLVWTLSSF